ncbi:NAD-dependent epimerase/dehydratase family protein [Nocardia sp. NPDC060220]|uniref:NAD-dependent epimerase/dehydratase family protein n=1 Tax=Nocardia sp. NPDC060220 TaxID=3347076 RepID=UPI003654B29C
MQVLLAGATGAIGRPLIRALTANGHTVWALVRNPGAHPLVRELGATPVTADVLDRDGLLRAVEGLRAEAVIHQATALRDAKVQRRIPADDPTGLLRTVGTANLLDAAAVVGAGRFVTQSLILGYGYHDHGGRLVTERDQFGVYDGGVGWPTRWSARVWQARARSSMRPVSTPSRCGTGSSTVPARSVTCSRT